MFEFELEDEELPLVIEKYGAITVLEAVVADLDYEKGVARSPAERKRIRNALTAMRAITRDMARFA